jgi:hypothetical protein
MMSPGVPQQQRQQAYQQIEEFKVCVKRTKIV